jgi:hypothetical protein
MATRSKSHYCTNSSTTPFRFQKSVGSTSRATEQVPADHRHSDVAAKLEMQRDSRTRQPLWNPPVDRAIGAVGLHYLSFDLLQAFVQRLPSTPQKCMTFCASASVNFGRTNNSIQRSAAKPYRSPLVSGTPSGAFFSNSCRPVRLDLLESSHRHGSQVGTTLNP